MTLLCTQRVLLWCRCGVVVGLCSYVCIHDWLPPCRRLAFSSCNPNPSYLQGASPRRREWTRALLNGVGWHPSITENSGILPLHAGTRLRIYVTRHDSVTIAVEVLLTSSTFSYSYSHSHSHSYSYSTMSIIVMGRAPAGV